MQDGRGGHNGRRDGPIPSRRCLSYQVTRQTSCAVRAPLWVLGVASALFGLAHAGGWVAIPFAVLFALAGRLVVPTVTS